MDLGLAALLVVCMVLLASANNPVSKVCFTLLVVIMAAAYAVDEKPRR